MGPSGGQPARTWQVTISSLFPGSRDRLRELAEARVQSPLGKPPFDDKHRTASEAGVFRRGRTTGPQPGVGARVPRTEPVT
jgi:hypothetical protein